MKVKNKQTGVVVEATKVNDTTYSVEGKEVAKADMASLYEIVKTVKPKPKDEELTIISGETEMGGNIGALAKALANCQGEFEAVKKSTKAYNYDYADIQAVLGASMPITSKYGLSITQVNLSKVAGEHLLVGVKTILMHEDGGYITGEIFVPAVKSKSNTLVQMSGVNITYLRRYGIQSALGLATTDNDGSEK